MRDGSVPRIAPRERSGNADGVRAVYTGATTALTHGVAPSRMWMLSDVYVVEPSTSAWNPCRGDKDQFGRICKRMLEKKGVPEKEVNKLGGYKDASHGKVGKHKVGAGFEYKLATMHRFLKVNYPHLLLHAWDPVDEIGARGSRYRSVGRVCPEVGR